ncbi:hypothetical protein ACPRNU_09885 [Chromobacterium vaccinii]|uniref:hypothetical protein n=1 Tax=Chromobacterium vaccinii TaxID=1108595 RepID=UPI003C723A5B
MGKERERYKSWKRAQQQLDEVFKKPEHTIVIHYSCESFYNRENPRSPRVTSIAIRNLDSGQTKSFSIHLIAERQGLLDSTEQHYDQLERQMLEEFFKAVNVRSHCQWLHWNMRDANYGFEALENRIRALGGEPIATVPEDKRVDLSRILGSIYGAGYSHHPRLENIISMNNITAKDFLTGKNEAQAFEDKAFLRLHQSTLRKVDILANIAGRAHANDLKTLSTWWERNGRSFKAAFEWIRENWIIGAIIAIIGYIISAWDWIKPLAHYILTKATA